MDSSGAAAWVAGHSIERLPEGLPVWLIQLAMALLTTLFSLVISHVGATIVMVPLAINLALAVGGSPTAFALIVAMSASNNFMTASNPSISMITGPAGYTARDMWRVGGPLSLVYTAIVVLMVNLMFSCPAGNPPHRRRSGLRPRRLFAAHQKLPPPPQPRPVGDHAPTSGDAGSFRRRTNPPGGPPPTHE